jgi:hypothetical protein
MKRNTLHKILILAFIFVNYTAFAQLEKPKDANLIIIPVAQENNDTVIYRVLEDINIYPRRIININSSEYKRMVKRLRKVYPYAKEAAKEMELYNTKFMRINNNRARRQYVKKVEKELYARHEKEMKKFTITEGRYLMLLIDREIGNSSYDLVKELKGTLPAMFWQGFAKIFGNDLKEKYDPIYKHFMIEQIVLMIEKENS